MSEQESGDRPLQGRVILISGAGGGIGSVVARAVAAAGAECILLSRSESSLNPVYDAIVSDGSPEPALFPLDFTRASTHDYQLVADGIDTDCGRLDGIIHLAARFDGLMPLSAHDIDDWRRIMHVNTTAAFALTRVCLPLLQAAADAAVLFCVDRASPGKAFHGAYGASKAALLSMTQMLALEHARAANLRFNAIDPGPRTTALRKAAFPADDPAARPPAEVAEQFVHCIGPATRGVTGRLFDADGNTSALGV